MRSPPSPRTSLTPTPLPAVVGTLSGRTAALASDLDLLRVLVEGGPQRVRGSAARLLERFATVRGLASATALELCEGGRLTLASAQRLEAALELGRRAQSVALKRGEPLRTTSQIYAAYGPLLRDLRKEVLLALHIDAKGRVAREERISEGTLTHSHAHPREIFGPALRQGAAGLILVHNHPSGDPEPSPEDVACTQRLCAVGDLVGIRLLDHVVLGDTSYVSLLERGAITG